MILIYTPVDGPAHTWDLEDIASSEGEAIERATGLAWDDIETRLRKNSPGVKRAAAWVFVKRTQTDLRYGDFDPPRRSIKVFYDVQEMATTAAQIDAAGFNPAQLVVAMGELRDMAMDEASWREFLATRNPDVPAAPKDAAPPSETSD